MLAYRCKNIFKKSLPVYFISLSLSRPNRIWINAHINMLHIHALSSRYRNVLARQLLIFFPARQFSCDSSTSSNNQYFILINCIYTVLFTALHRRPFSCVSLLIPLGKLTNIISIIFCFFCFYLPSLLYLVLISIDKYIDYVCVCAVTLI